jgi:two-component system, LytTR family, sensor kinase
MKPSANATTSTVCPTEYRVVLGVRDLNWWVVFLVYTVGAFISAGTIYTSDLAQRAPGRFFSAAFSEFTGYYTAFCFIPLLVLGFKRFPILRSNWRWTVPLHVLFSIAFGVAHTLSMLASRTLAYSFLGLGHYDYGDMNYRFFMEYQKQGMHYWLVYAVLRMLAYQRENRERERRAAALELQTSELQRRLAQVQLEALRTQLNPHFLFNTLNMISSVMYEDTGRADHMLSSLSQMLRMALTANAASRVTVHRELEFIGCAVELIEARFKDRVHIQIECEEGTASLLVPNMMLYTLLENAVKHHDREREPVMRIRVAVKRRDGMLLLEVTDNGPGVEDVDRAMNKGVGLSNTRQRLLALYDDRYQLELRNRPEGGLVVAVAIPAELEREPEAIPAPA